MMTMMFSIVYIVRRLCPKFYQYQAPYKCILMMMMMRTVLNHKITFITVCSWLQDLVSFLRSGMQCTLFVSSCCWPQRCGLRGCKNRPAPFHGRMSYKATKPGLVLFYICFNCIVAYQGPFLCIVNYGCTLSDASMLYFADVIFHIFL